MRVDLARRRVGSQLKRMRDQPSRLSMGARPCGPDTRHNIAVAVSTSSSLAAKDGQWEGSHTHTPVTSCVKQSTFLSWTVTSFFFLGRRVVKKCTVTSGEKEKWTRNLRATTRMRTRWTEIFVVAEGRRENFLGEKKNDTPPRVNEQSSHRRLFVRLSALFQFSGRDLLTGRSFFVKNFYLLRFLSGPLQTKMADNKPEMSADWWII